MSDEAESAKAESEADPAPTLPVSHPLDSWFDRWFPENSTTPDAPVKYMSAEWHHVRAAFADLKARLSNPNAV